MRLIALVAVYQRPNTSKPAAALKVYPYLLGGLSIDRVNQVWCSDITYIPMAKGFVYLVAIMDWHSRAVLAWRLSNTLGADFCVEALEEALARFGRPEIFNTDQGSQFTSDDFTGVLRRHEVTISMDGKGRCMDNVFIERLWRSLKYTKRFTCMPMATSPRLRPASGLGWFSTTRSANIKAMAIARRGKCTKHNAGGYVDADGLRFPRFPSQLEKRANARLRPHLHRHNHQHKD
jgi:putative transposase